MKNVEMKVEGHFLTIKVDLTKDFGPSSSGKTIIIASTEGNVSIPDKEDITIGLNIYKKYCLMTTCMTKAAGTSQTLIKLSDLFKFHLHHRHKNHLCDALTDINGKSGVAPVPAGDKNLSLIVRINQTDQIAQNDAVFMPQTGSGQ